MKQLTIVVLVLLFCVAASAQKKFIKEIIDPNYGSSIRVLPTNDLGWVVFSMDSLRLTKFNACGESEWSKKYYLANTNNGLNDFIKTKDGGFALLTRILNGNKYGSLVTKIDSTGTIIWSNSYGDASYNHYPYTLSEDQQGDFILFGNVTYYIAPTVYNMVCKISGNGNLISTRFYNYGYVWGGAIVTSDNGVLMRTGWIFIKTDNAGNLQWTSNVIGAADYNYFAPIEVSDGYIFTGYTNNNAICFGKLDKQGNLQWGGRRTSDFIGIPPKLHRKTNGNIVGVFNKNGFTTTVELDKDLNVIAQNAIGITTLNGKDICFLSDGTPIVGGIGTTNPFFARLDQEYHTRCEVTTNQINFITETATASFINTVLTSSDLNVITQNYQIEPVSVSLANLCNVPKVLYLGNDTLLCKGTTMVLKNQTGDLFDHYQWSTGETTSTITIHQEGAYWLLVNDDCRENRFNDTVWIHILPAIEADLGTDLLLCEQTSHLFVAPVCDSCSFEWNTGSHSGSMEVNQQGTYWLSVKNNNGCTSWDTVEVSIVKCECDFYVPNAFTPNDDGLNELFKPLYHCDMEDYTMKVFNRWGQLVFATDNKTYGWNAKFNNSAVPSGIYLYVFNYRPLIKGKLNDCITKSGTVAVIY